MNLICTIMVIIKFGEILVGTEHTLQGKIISESNENYVADFSVATKKYSDVVGDYSSVLVKKEKCVKLKN